MVSEALRVNEIIEGEDARKKAECTHPSLLSQIKGMVIYVFICQLHKSRDLPITHNSTHISGPNSGPYGPGNPKRCLMKAMMAAEKAELSTCVPLPARVILLLFVFIYHGSA